MLAIVLMAGTVTGCGGAGAGTGTGTGGTGTGVRNGVAGNGAARAAGPGGVAVLASALAARTATGGSDAPSDATSDPVDPVPRFGPAVPTATATRAVAGDFAIVSSPSGNIGCQLTSTQARCDIVNKAWTIPPKPAGCVGDYGSAVTVGGSGKATLACVADSASGSSDVLGYGSAVTFGDFLVISSQSGMYCRNTRTGHGFTLAIQRYELF